MQVVSIPVSNKLANMGFLCSIFVVLIHVWTPVPVGSFAWFLYALTSFRGVAVPFFFLMSGYLLAGHFGNDNWWMIENRKRVKSLLIPYVLWSALWMLFLLLRQGLDNCLHERSLFFGIYSIVSDHRFLGLDLFSRPQFEVLWYVRSLMFFVLCSPVFLWMMKKCSKLFWGIAFIGLFFHRCMDGTYFYLVDSTISISYLFYFCLGMALRMKSFKIPKKDFKALACFFAVVLWCVIHGMLYSCGQERPSGIIRFVVGRLEIFNNLLWMYLIWMVIPAKALPKCFSNLAFPIYLIHWFVLCGIWQYFMYKNPRTVLELIMSFVVGIGGTLGMVSIVRWRFPRLAYGLFGGR